MWASYVGGRAYTCELASTVTSTIGSWGARACIIPIHGAGVPDRCLHPTTPQCQSCYSVLKFVLASLVHLHY